MSDSIPNKAPFVPSRTVPLKHFGQAGAKQELAALKLTSGRRYGLLTIGPRSASGKEISAVCECGYTGWYAPARLLEMCERRTGCGRPECTVISLHDAVRADPEEGLRLQLSCLLLLCPENVQSRWGGTMDDFEVVSIDEAVADLAEYLKAQGKAASGSVWLGRLDESLPFMEGNLRWSSRPDVAFRRLSRQTIDVGGQEMYLSELVKLTGLPVRKLVLRLCRLGQREDLLFALLNPEEDPHEP